MKKYTYQTEVIDQPQYTGPYNLQMYANQGYRVAHVTSFTTDTYNGIENIRKAYIFIVYEKEVEE